MSNSSPATGARAGASGDIGLLAKEVEGPVFGPEDEGYSGECAPYNLAMTHQPAVVVGAAGPGDVGAAIRFAGEHGLPVGVMATGHGASVAAEGGMLVSTRRMNGIAVDRPARMARIGAGVRSQQLIDAAAASGLAPLTGSSPLVAVTGFTLGGGLSPVLGRTRGWAADHVRAFEIVTADGVTRRLTAAGGDELFWAVRGGKDNFGIVTALELDLFEMPRLYGGGLYFPGAMAADVLDGFREWTSTAPEELTVSVALLRLPPLSSVPEPLRGQFTVHVRVAFLGSAIDGEQLVAPIRGLGPAIIDTVAEMPYAALGSIHAEPRDPLPVYDGSLRLAEFPAAAAGALVQSAGADSGSPLTVVEVRHLGGALARAPEVPSAVTGRDALFQVSCIGLGKPGDAGALYASQDNLFRGLRPWQDDQATLNYLTARDTSPAALRTAFGAATFGRLAAIKRAYDPANTFRLNFNIPPAR
jgi:hypothetical protein